MVLNEIYKHQDTWYQILRKTPTHSFEEQNGVINMEILKEWRDYLGGDHVLRVNNEFWICKTIQDAEIIEN